MYQNGQPKVYCVLCTCAVTVLRYVLELAVVYKYIETRLLSIISVSSLSVML